MNYERTITFCPGRKLFLKALFLCWLLAAVLILAPPPAAAATYTVNTYNDTIDAITGDTFAVDQFGKCSLRAAIMEANAYPATADTIILPTGTFTLSRGSAGNDDIDAALGDLDILGAITIIGDGGNQDGNPAATKISTTGIDKVFSINPNHDRAFSTKFKAVTIMDGSNTSADPLHYNGGAFDWEASGSGSLEIYNCVIKNNSNTNGPGGGIFLSNGVAGTIANVTISKSDISYNTCQSGSGGGIYLGPRIMAQITDSTISNNTTYGGSGGGIYADGTDIAEDKLLLKGCTFYWNTATGQGGGIYSTKYLEAVNSTISANLAGVEGGGLWLNGKTQILTNDTVEDNQGGGIYWGGTGSLPLGNCIVAGNFLSDAGSTPNDIRNEGASNTLSGTYSIIGPGGVSGTAGNGGITDGVNGNRVLGDLNELKIGSIASNGGYTQTHALLAGSPALNTGNDALITTANFGDPPHDQRGVGYPRISGTHVDIGAFEAQYPDLTLTKSHTGDFTQGQTGATYTLTVTNSGTGPTSGAVTVTDTLPAGLTATAMSGTGWTCNPTTGIATRSDALAAGASYPAITLTVNVAANASASLTNTASVSGGGEL
ncbi:MAG: choice-of-anchor Q domain-containing protein, partial [Desulfocucumaceae bacterium]